MQGSSKVRRLTAPNIRDLPLIFLGPRNPSSNVILVNITELLLFVIIIIRNKASILDVINDKFFFLQNRVSSEWTYRNIEVHNQNLKKKRIR